MQRLLHVSLSFLQSAHDRLQSRLGLHEHGQRAVDNTVIQQDATTTAVAIAKIGSVSNIYLTTLYRGLSIFEDFLPIALFANDYYFS